MLLAVAFICSFSTLKLAMTMGIPMGTAYAVWSGIGTGGGTLAGMLIYNESKNIKRIFFIVVIVLAIVGLKSLVNVTFKFNTVSTKIKAYITLQ